MRSSLAGLFLSAFCCVQLPLHAQDAASVAPAVATRIAAQNALFEQYYQDELKNSPERATSIGDYRFNDQLDDDSLAAIARRHAADQVGG